ncbi:hypothetical protein PC110_g21408 [Phytophthora cactorum]|uniref:Tc1-like transposase DDE domain-containing protein n=1 Tax=Phytophthora cactorum TaxID=29920 RepID=A0A329RDN2_9STRA|nr:hypothetical protein PC110_g21408 [Phytophthora cactorum]
MPRAPPRLSSSTPPRCVATKEERQRVLDAYEAGDDWLTVARYNNVSRAAAYRLCKSGDPRPPPGGGARANCVKCTNEMVSALKDYLEEDCTLTLVQLHDKIMDRFQLQRRSIRRGVNAAFLKRIYETVKASATYRVYFVGKKVIIVLDNAPTNNQPEERLKEVIAEHGDLELLCLGLYSPMLNPIEGYFSVFMARVKAYLAEHRQRVFVQANTST